MAPKITEVFQVKVNDKFHSDPSLFTRLRNGAEKGGLKRQSYGIDVTDSANLIWILHFEEGETPRDFIWPVAEYGDFIAQLNEIAASPLTTHFFPFESFPMTVTSAPVTEIAIVTIKASVDLEAAKKILQISLGNVVGARGCLGADWSLASNNDRKAYFFIGWESVEHHIAYTHTDVFKEEQKQVGTIMEKGELVHVEFTDHKSL